MNIRFTAFSKFIFLSIFILFITPSLAQPINKLVVINSDKGLSQNSVYAISKDAKGFLWIGTGDGLNRYDGKEFLSFRNTPSQTRYSLRGFTISHTIREDNMNNLWFSTENNLVKYNQPSKTFNEIIPFNDTLHSKGNKAISVIDTLRNMIWFFTPAECLYSYNYVDKKFKRFDFPTSGGTEKIFLHPNSVGDDKENIWIVSTDGLFCFNRKSEVWKQFFKGKNFQNICIDTSGKLWLLNENTLYCFDPDKLTCTTFKNHSSFSKAYISITSDKNGKVWCGTIDGKLYYASEQNKELIFAGDINKMSGSQNVLELRCLYVDASGLLWIGTEGGGLIKVDLKPVNFNNYPSPETHYPINTLYIKSIFCDNDGKVWLGSFKKGGYIFDPATGEATPLKIPENKNFKKYGDVIYSIKKDNKGIYWLGYDGCLIAYNIEKNKYYFHCLPVEISNTRPLINHISIQKDHLLISSTGGLYKAVTSNNGQKVAFQNILSTSVMESLYTSDGTLWTSSIYLGLLKVLPQAHNAYASLFSGNGFRCLTEDKENKILWAASQMGLLAYHLPTGKHRFYDEKNGLLNTYLYGIIKNGNEIWVSTNKGIAQGILLFKNNEQLPEITFKGYTKEDGLQSNEFNTGAYDIAQNGMIYFGGINGLNWFLPKNVLTNTCKPSVVITSLKINDTPYFKNTSPEFLQSLTTRYNNNTFTIKFIGLEFSNPAGIKYKFKLEGLEKEWTSEKNAREVRYANLRPGKYIFKVVAANQDNVLSDETTLSINILPPFYGTWWFRILIAVILVSAIISITQKLSQLKLKKKIRLLEKQKALEDERHRISKEMHDDLGAGLTQISLISEAAKRGNKAGRFPGDELNDISATSKQLIENVSEIIWAMNPEFDSLSSMIAYLREQISKLLEYSGKQYYIQLPDDYVEVNISNLKRKNISMLMKEAVNNAIKHSNATSVYVKMVLINEYLEIEIKDNGKGFDTRQMSQGHGIKNYIFRTGLLNGTSNVISNNCGTEVYFRIPLRD